MTSNRFEELERRCIKLKKARVMRIVFSIGFLFLGAFATYYWMYHYKDISAPQVTVMSYQPIENVIVLDMNESNITDREEDNTSKEISEDVLFLSPHLDQNHTTLPRREAHEAKRSLVEEQQLLKRFNEDKNFTNAYALAHFYFRQKSYTEAVFWAKETSKYNSSTDKPWILYAKAKFRLGERAEAIRSLELFLSYINSQEAQDLLIFYKGQK